MAAQQAPVAENDKAQLLSQLHDIELPASTGLQVAPIVWILLLLALVALWFWWERSQPQKPVVRDWRPDARLELARIRSTLEQQQLVNVVPDCSRLARRVALSVRPREAVASLTGAAWLSVLDELSQSGQFTQGPGQMLADGPYRRHHPEDAAQLGELMGAMEHLVESAGVAVVDDNDAPQPERAGEPA